jgi:acetyl-CoA C-acetyltransferase
MNKVYFVDGSRTPFLRARGKPGPFTASDLAVQAGHPLLLRQPFAPDALDQVILGCVSSGPDEANIARVTSLRLGCGEAVPAWTVQRNCASGMQALVSAAQDIAVGRSELVLAGGTETMSHHPLLLDPAMVEWLAAWNRAAGLAARGRLLTRLRPAMLQPVVALLRGLSDPIAGLSMGQTAEQLAWRFNIGREAMDTFALESHRRLGRAQTEARLEEIEPMFDHDGRLYEADDGCRPDSDLEKLGKLKPVFDRPVGKVTAGNSAQVTDGAAWLLLASESALERHGLEPLGRLVDSRWAALDPREMGLGPVHAMAPLLRDQGLESDAIDYWEINEAFAAQVLACLAAWQSDGYCSEQLGLKSGFETIPSERLNVDGGGISLGHPVGASGARIVLHLLHVLQQKEARRGMASLCVGGGQGGAVLVEREA